MPPKPLRPVIDVSNPLSGGLVLDLNFTERGGFVYREKVAGLQFTTSSPPSSVIKKDGTALDFSNHEIHTSSIARLRVPQKNTFEILFYIDSFPGAGADYLANLFSDENTGVGNGQSAIWRIGSQGNSIYSKRIGINFYDGSNHDNQNNTDLVVGRNHIVVTTDGANAKWYINGVLDTTSAYTITPNASTQGWYVGRTINGVRPLDGQIVYIRRWNRAIIYKEVKQLYADPWSIYRKTTPIAKAPTAGGVTVLPGVQTATFSIPTPTITAIRAVTLTPSAQSATFSIPTPTITAIRTVTVSAGVNSATFSIIAPTVVAGDVVNVSISVSTLTLAFSLLDPTVIVPASLVESRFTPKTFVYKVYTSSGSYVTNWSDDVISTPSFTTAINAGPGQLVIQLARPFESFGEGDDIIFGNRVDCYVFDSDTPTGMLLYRGFISSYAPILEGGTEYLKVILLPYISIASKIMLRETDLSTTVPFLSKDPADIFRGIVTRGVADGLDIETTANSIDDAGTSVSYTFNTNTVKEAFDKAIELAPDGWYWRVDPDGTLHVHEKTESVDHDLLIGKHIKTMNPEKRTENIINRVYFTGGGDPPLYRVYSREGSISAYGLRAVKVVDQRVELSATAQIIATRILNESEAPEVRTRLVIIDNNGKPERGGYDIESIKVGDTIRIKNLQYGQKSESLWDVMVWDVDVWDQTLSSIAGSALLVVKTSYRDGNSIEVETSSRFPVVSKRIEDINRSLQDSQTVNNPSSPS